MNSSAVKLSIAAAVAVATAGCASTYDLEPDLRASVGVYAGEFNAALWARRTLISDDGTTRTLQYTLGEDCRFVLELDSQTFVVKGWRYADEVSGRTCRRLSSRRAV